MRKAEEAAMRFGAKGFKIKVSGRLNGAEIARTEDYLSGQMPLQTIRANVDYGFAEARTLYGKLGVKNRTQAAAKARSLGLLRHDSG